MIKLNKIYKTILVGGFAVAMSTLFVSCEKFNDWQVDESSNRLFRPAELTADVDGVTARLSWKGMPNTDAYTIELAKDSLQFASIIKTYTPTVTTDSTGDYFFVIPDLLDPLTQYSARVKGTNATGTPAQSQWTNVTFKTKTEQIMFAVASADLTATSVTLKWKAPNEVTHFMLGSTRYDVSPAEKTAGAKTISGLAPKTNYTAVLYNNANIRGQQSFRTPAQIPAGGTIVGATDDLATMLTTAAPGTIFVLLEGTKYTTDNAIVLPDGASFTIWGEEGGVKPIVAFNGFTLPANAGTIKFENIDLTGYQNGDAALPKRNYIFNQSAASSTSEIIFENCTIRNFVNTPMRLQGSAAITIGNFIVNRCTVYDIGDNNANGTYAFINSNVATGKINNITISNSTFYKIGYGLILHNSAPSQTVTIENNTFYNVVGNTRYFIDYNAQTIAGGFTFRNNIIGKTLSPAASARGIRAGTAPTVINSYKTSDAVFASNAIPGIQDYNKTSAELFTSPDTGNFLIKDNAFPGKSDSGDPRWRL